MLHDIWEGVAKKLVAAVVEDFLLVCKISIDTLNNAISQFPYDNIEKHIGKPTKNCVAKVDGEIVVRCSGSQVRVLCTRLPLILFSIIPKKNEYFNHRKWRHFILLLKIVSYLHSPTLTEENLTKLQTLIAAFLSLTVEIYGSSFITCKFHNLIHYPDQIREYGPVIFHTTFASERSYQMLKKCVNSNKNILLSISKHCSAQLLLFVKEKESAMRNLYSNFCYRETPKDIIKYFPFLPSEILITPQYRSNFFISVGSAIITSKLSDLCQPDFVPTIMIVKYIICLNNVVSLVCRELLPFNAFPSYCHLSTCYIRRKPISTHSLSIIPLKNLEIQRCFSIHQIENRLYIIMESVPHK